ncbi:hypothetical protein [Actinokineospora cianjurensis]|uniref:Uncharacterized protein n=1 Tax=Actinokineospora cianjurensis TaxID=585224 RepID=A0A421B333_9PSEU|nr:hypothetical protein [Actinokineospora cianjurensis]RLK58789.1 hypothetical protein CLV68_3264 [Actinokineospora cianjurensis]
MRGRIWFQDNPWPEGHAIATFEWTAGLDDNGHLWFDPVLITEDYDAERMPEEPPDRTREWDSPELWTNYEGCLIEPLDQHAFLAATPGSPFSFTATEPRTLTLDPLPEPPDARHAFQFHLLGHDTCADHTFVITRQPDGHHRIDWTARIALTYAGETEYLHAFRAELHDCVPTHITYPAEMTPDQAHHHLTDLIDIHHHLTPARADGRPVLRYTGP